MGLDPATLIALMSGNGGGSTDNPLQQLLAQQFGLQATPAPTAPAEPTAATSALHREVAVLDAELRRLQELVADVGSALGACGRCLGRDPSCNACGGDGIAGTLDPDTSRFDELIAPAVVRLAEEEAAMSSS